MADYQWLKNILFLDIETVSIQPSLDQLDERMQTLWAKKTQYVKTEQTPQELFPERAAIYAEFGKVLVIGIGFFTIQQGEITFRCKALKNENETALLQEFSDLLNQLTAKESWRLCAHNGKEFDFPYLCRRLLINGLPLPKLLQIMGKKPWETPQLIDTMELWKFGDIKAYTSLELMAACLGVPTSKDDIDGSQVGKVFYESGDVDRIAAYCQKDVAVMAQVFMKLMGLGVLRPEQIEIKD
jgi:hypothetical protein